MKDTKFRILLDIHEVRSQATIPVKVGDVSCKIYITLVEGGKPYKIHENSFGVFTGKKGDNNPIFNNCIIENGIIRYDFTPQTVAAAGVLECEIRIYDEDGGVLTTPSFNIVVDERAVNDSELASAPEFAFLDEILVNEGQRIENEKNRNEAFNNLGIDLEDDGEVISIVKTDIDGSQEKASFLKYADVIPPVTATATGSAITIDSANAPLQNLKLFGKTEQDGTPTPDAPIELKSVGDSGSFEVGVYGKNLLDVSGLNGCFTETGAYGVSLNVASDGLMSLVGTAKTGGGRLTSNARVTLPKGKYALKIYDANGKITTTFAGGAYLSNAKGNSVVTVHTSKFELQETTTLIFGINLVVGVTYNGSAYAMICRQDETNLDYEPFKSKQTLTFTDTLRGISDIADEKDFAKGVKMQRFEMVDLGTLTWKRFGATENREDIVRYESNISTKPSKPILWALKANVLCEALKADTYYNAYHKTNNNIISIYTDGKWFEVATSGYLSAEEFKSAMSGVMAIYELATPIETPLTEQELNAYRQLHTNKPNTTILSEADMEVDYYINKPNAQAIGNIHSQVNKDYLKLQQAIISTGGSTL